MPLRVIAWLAAAAVVTGRVVEATRSHVYGDDLRVFWLAGRLAAHHGDPWVRGFDYAPASLALFAPIGTLPFDAARTLWLVTGVVVLVATATAVARRFGVPPAVAVVITFAVFPTASALEFANATVLELPFLVLLAGAVADRRWRRAAVLAAVAIALKPLLLPCLLAFVVHRRWRALVAVGVALLAVSAVALAAVGHVRAYRAQLTASLRTAADDPRSADLGALAARHEVTASLAVAIGVLAVVAAAVVATRSGRPAARLAAPLAASFLVGPVCWAHYPLLLLPLLAELAVGGRRAARVGAWVAVGLLAAPELVHGGPLLAVPPGPLFALVTAAVVVALLAALADVGRAGATRAVG